MKRFITNLQKLDSVYTGLWLPALFFSGWLVAAYITWFFPFNTDWTIMIRQNTLPFFLLGVFLHLTMCILHQQILFMKDDSTHVRSNLTVELFFYKAVRMFIWAIPWYLCFASVLYYRSFYLSIFDRVYLSGIWKIMAILILFCLILILGSVYWIGMTLFFRHEGRENLFLPFQIWIKAIKLFFTHLHIWMWFCLFCFLVGAILLAISLFSWFIACRLQPDPSLFWEWFYPTHWLVGVILASIGLESFCLPFFSFAGAESIQP